MKANRLSILALGALTAALTLGTLAYPVTGLSDEGARQGDFVRGAKAWANNCTRCHNVRDPKELRDDQWLTTMYHMRVRGGLTGQDTRDILTFLQKSN